MSVSGLEALLVKGDLPADHAHTLRTEGERTHLHDVLTVRTEGERTHIDSVLTVRTEGSHPQIMVIEANLHIMVPFYGARHSDMPSISLNNDLFHFHPSYSLLSHYVFFIR